MSASTLQELAQAVVDARWAHASKGQPGLAAAEEALAAYCLVAADLLRDLKAAEARGRAPAAEDWRLMETAPRDATQRLLACWEHEDGTRHVVETWWCNTYWYGDNKYGKYTHWKPWPTPPGGGGS